MQDSNSVPVISVLMLAYNHELFAEQAVRSVLAQKCDVPIEIVIGEDRSKDRTLEILERLQQEHPERIRIIKRDGNVGMMRNFVETYNSCCGEFIALLECDDFWTDPNKLKLQLEHMRANPKDSVVFHNVRKLETTAESVSTETVVVEKPVKVETLSDVWTAGPFFTCSSFVRRSSLSSLDESFLSMPIADWPLFIILASKGSFGFIDKPMATYRIHAGGIWSSTTSIARLQSDTKVLRQLDAYFDYRYSTEINEAISKRHCWMGHAFSDDGNRSAAIGQLLRGFRRFPGIAKNPQQIKLLVKCFAPKSLTTTIKQRLKSTRQVST